MRFKTICDPLPGLYRVETLVERLRDENGRDEIYGAELLTRAHKAIGKRELQSRDGETGYPIDADEEPSPLVTIADFNKWLKSWECPFTLLDASASEPGNKARPDVPETKEQRQDRRLKDCEDAGLVMPVSSAGRLPDGVGDVAARQGVTRQAFSTDVKAALQRREAATRAGGTVHRA